MQFTLSTRIDYCLVQPSPNFYLPPSVSRIQVVITVLLYSNLNQFFPIWIGAALTDGSLIYLYLENLHQLCFFLLVWIRSAVTNRS